MRFCWKSQSQGGLTWYFSISSWFHIYLGFLLQNIPTISTLNDNNLLTTRCSRSVQLKVLEQRNWKAEQFREGIRDRVTDTSWDLGWSVSRSTELNTAFFQQLRQTVGCYLGLVLHIWSLTPSWQNHNLMTEVGMQSWPLLGGKRLHASECS